MPPPDDVRLGRLSQQVVEGAAWLTQDAYPSSQCWADELESLLVFLDANGQLEKFVPRIRDVNHEHRTATLAEARTAYFLDRMGFQVCAWEPLAQGTRPGDLTVLFGDSGSIFVEVKAPAWLGELGKRLAGAAPDERERIKKRIGEEKYRNGEARFVNPAGTVIDVIDKNAIPKLGDDRPNLIAVVDDLFSPVVGNPFATSSFEKAFASLPQWDRIGAVLLLHPGSYSDSEQLLYRCELIINAGSLPSCRLPPPAVSALEVAAKESLTRFKELTALPTIEDP